MKIYYITKIALDKQGSPIWIYDVYFWSQNESETKEFFEKIRKQKHDYFKQLLDSDEYVKDDDYCFMVNTEDHIHTYEGDKSYHYHLKSIDLDKP